MGLPGTRPSQDAMENCDPLLIVGSSFPCIGFYPKPGQARSIQIDSNPARIGLRYPVEVGIIGDSKRVLQALLPKLFDHSDKEFLRKAQQGEEERWQAIEERSASRDRPMTAAGNRLGTGQTQKVSRTAYVSFFCGASNVLWVVFFKRHPRQTEWLGASGLWISRQSTAGNDSGCIQPQRRASQLQMAAQRTRGFVAHSKQARSALPVILRLGVLSLIGTSAVLLYSSQARPTDSTRAAPATPGKTSAAAPARSEHGAATTEASEQNAGRTPKAVTARSWKILEEGLTEKEVAKRTEAVAALAIAGPQPKAVSLLESALTDKDPVVRETAIVALGEMKSRGSIPRLRQMLQDDAPEVSFAAARTLWRMGDPSGRRVLLEVLVGERKTSGGELGRKIGEAKETLHDPKAMAKIGAEQGASVLLGPFAIGIKVAEELRKDNSATGRAVSASLLATDKTAQSAEELEQALNDKNWLVRAAAAKSLAKRKYRHALPRIEALLDDEHDVVRYSAAGAILALE